MIDERRPPGAERSMEQVERTLADMPAQMVLWVYCRACGHCAAPRRRNQWLTRFGPSVSIEALTRRLCCSRCGERAATLYRCWDAGPAYDTVD